MILQNANILIVEDEPLVALDLAFGVEDEGGTVIGPAATLVEALSLVTKEIQGAILDFHLPDGDVSEVLHALLARGLPVVVQTGGGLPAGLTEEYPNLVVLMKPNDPARLVAELWDQMRP